MIRRLLLCALVLTVSIGLVQSSSSVELVVTAGSNPNDNCPVVYTLSPDEFWYTLSEGSWKLVNDEEEIPVMVVRRNKPKYAFELSPAGTYVTSIDNYVWQLLFVVNGLEPYEQRVYTFEKGKAETDNPVTIERNEGALDIKIGGKPFSTYRYAVTEKQPRPILYPVFGPDGVRVTRGYPMEKFEGEREDHPHHQSLWVSHGDVNGVNFWHLGDEQGYQKLSEFSTIQSGPVCGIFEALNNWTDQNDKKVLEEVRRVTVWGTPDSGRMIDLSITLVASEGDVTFGDTKEGGLVSLRVAGTMKEDADKGGLITNAQGQHSQEAWGKASPWCDYSGPVGGKTVGLTIMDHPANPFYPTRYHVRTYGLFTANPFGLSHFVDRSKDGTQVLKDGEAWRLNYRIYIHEGDVESGNVKHAYANYVDGPSVSIRR